MNISHHDVVIMGANHTGLTIALMLADLDLEVLVLGELVVQQQPSGRLLALAHHSLDILLPYVGDLPGQPINSILVKEGKAELLFLPNEISLENFGCMIGEFHLAKILHDKVLEHSSITIAEQEVLGWEEGNLYTANQQYNAKLFIAADGKHSRFRDWLGIEVWQKDYHQYAVVLEVQHANPHHGLAVECFLEGGPLALLPQNDAHRSSIVWTIPTEALKTVQQFSKEEWQYWLSKHAPLVYGSFTVLTEASYFPLKQVLAKEYTKDGVVLLGDAVHSIHPLAGQGYNLILRDAAALLNMVADNKRLGINLNYLPEYQKVRQADNNLMAEATDFINAVFMWRSIGVFRRFGLSALNQLPWLKKKFMQYAVGNVA